MFGKQAGKVGAHQQSSHNALPTSMPRLCRLVWGCVFVAAMLDSFSEADEFDLTHWHKQPHWPGECLNFDGSQPLMFLTLFHDGISHHIINHHKAGRKKEANDAAKRMCMEHCLKFRKWCLAIELVGSHVHPERKLPGCGLVTDAETFFKSGEVLHDHRYGAWKYVSFVKRPPSPPRRTSSPRRAPAAAGWPRTRTRCGFGKLLQYKICLSDGLVDGLLRALRRRRTCAAATAPVAPAAPCPTSRLAPTLAWPGKPLSARAAVRSPCDDCKHGGLPFKHPAGTP